MLPASPSFSTYCPGWTSSQIISKFPLVPVSDVEGFPGNKLAAKERRAKYPGLLTEEERGASCLQNLRCGGNGVGLREPKEVRVL